jgi:hypothetical protein
MFLQTGVTGSGRKIRLALCFMAMATLSQAATIGVYGGSEANQQWAASGNFSTIYANATSGSLNHTVVSTSDITQTNLNNYRFLVVSNPITAMSTAQMTAVTNWVNQGGILLLFASGGQSTSTGIVNSILGRLGAGASGQTMSVGGRTYGDQYYVSSAGVFTGADPAVAGLAAGGLAYFYANQVNGGSLLAQVTGNNFDLGSMMRVDTFNLGKAYVFGERFDWNFLGTNNANNTQFFVNLLAQNTNFQLPGGGGGSFDASSPEPATFGMAGLVLTGLILIRRRSQK